MISEHTQSVAQRAKALFKAKLQADLEVNHFGCYVAIEPESENFFLSDTFGEAVEQARLAHPERISFVIRIGHQAALHLGGVAL